MGLFKPPAFFFLDDITRWGFSYFLAQLFLSGKAICHCYTHQLFVDGVSANYIEVLS